jgi:hypothetical protein
VLQAAPPRLEFVDEHLRAWKETSVSILLVREAFHLLLDECEHHVASHRSCNNHPMKGLFDKAQGVLFPVRHDLSKLVLYDPCLLNCISKARLVLTPLAK